MILFINFAPVEYMGGAERKIYELFCDIRKKESVVILTADNFLAGIYGKIVLGQKFEDRSGGSLVFENGERAYISLKSFIPFTQSWRKIRSLFKNARRIYIKCELNEFFFLTFFGGMRSFKKTVASIRSPWHYPSPISFMERIHNVVYFSFLANFFLKKLRRIHVLKPSDQKLFLERFAIRDVVCVPNYSNFLRRNSQMNDKIRDIKRNMHVVFVGELLLRKGIDTLLATIPYIPSKFIIHIVGEGPYKKDIIAVANTYKNVVYHGYLSNQDVHHILHASHVLLFPSRAEGFGGVIIEALSHGLPVIVSNEIALHLPKYIEYIIPSRNPESVLQTLENVYMDYFNGYINGQYIQTYCETYFGRNDNHKKMIDVICQ